MVVLSWCKDEVAYLLQVIIRGNSKERNQAWEQQGNIRCGVELRADHWLIEAFDPCGKDKLEERQGKGSVRSAI